MTKTTQDPKNMLVAFAVKNSTPCIFCSDTDNQKLQFQIVNNVSRTLCRTCASEVMRQFMGFLQ